jgi:ATP-dependent DNA helicase RecQ
MPSRFDPQREQLHHALRERRDAIARSGGVPPQSILGDVTLIDLVRVKPRSRLDLLRVQGMTDQKVERFGEEILEVVAMF